MAKKRKPENAWLPEHVTRGRSAYEYKVKHGKRYRLCSLTADSAEVIRAYDELIERLSIEKDSFASLIDAYFASDSYTKLSRRTQSDYAGNATHVLKVFGEMKPDDILPEHIRRYMDIRGKTAQVRANREHSFIRLVFSWAYQRGLSSGNPAKGVSQFTEKGRDYYITDAEYKAVYNRANNFVKAAMEISYCCAARKGDVLSLTREQLLEQGILFKQSKTGKTQIKAWSSRLRKAVALLKAQSSHLSYLFADAKGQRIPARTLHEWWSEAKEKAGLSDAKFTFHDIKAKSISDVEGNAADKQAFSGHKTIGMIATYDRKIPIVGSH